jgi:V/A-type H+-transporting ATPase subunit E
MGLEDIKKKIIEDAEAQETSIVKEAEQKALQIAEEKSTYAEKAKEQIISRAQEEAEVEKNRIITIEKLESRKKVLSAKQKVIEQVFSQSLDTLSTLDDYELFMENLICAVAHGGEEIILSPRDKNRLTKTFFDRINSKLEKALKISEETKDIAGGFILRSGDIEINESFDAKMKILRDEMESQVAQIIFSGDNE